MNRRGRYARALVDEQPLSVQQELFQQTGLGPRQTAKKTAALLREPGIQKIEASQSVTERRKAALGQFMTSPGLARFMASLFSPVPAQQARHVLDAGAGMGALCGALVERLGEEDDAQPVEVTAYEIDDVLRAQLENRLTRYEHVISHVLADDYIEQATAEGLQDQGYTHAILNPPYKKIHSRSAHRLALRRVGIETVNLYSAFVALAVGEMAKSGQVVAIIPRSFCNGPYYRPFRNFVLARAAIRQIHLFDSRRQAFKADGVLQENVIIHLECGVQQGGVKVSTSTDDSFSDYRSIEYPADRIIFPDDPERFIHVPTGVEQNLLESSPAICHTLADIGLKISTGPVVDFRVKEYLRAMPEPGTVPLIYPGHLATNRTTWPIPGMKKPNAIIRHADTEKWLYPNGFYCAVRRFSSKEEKRRVVAGIIEPESFSAYEKLGFENHLNVFHIDKQGLPEHLARGLVVFLNTTAVDEYFRRFNGHTQVNATDLKRLKYPSRDVLTQLGQWAMQQEALTQGVVDARLKEVLAV